MQEIAPINGMTIMQDSKLIAGTYVLPDGISIEGDDIQVVADGVHIIGKDHQARGITIKNSKNISLSGIAISTYFHGVYVENCEGISLKDLTIRDTHEIEGIDTFLYLWQNINEAYGGAIILHKVSRGSIKGCDVQHQLNGIQIYDSHHLIIESNNASFNSGWGVYLHASSDNLVQDNQLDFCNRLFRRPENGTIRAEADAAGIVMVQGSSRNRLLRNTCIGGGDGIFICGYQHPNIILPCNDNLIEGNDCRLSPNNAIESTFSKGNIFRKNDVSRSNYGLWMGYSWDNIVEENHVEFNRFVGIAIEHGHDFTIRQNTIQNNGEGVRLWLRGKRGDELLQYWAGYEAAYNFRLENNSFKSNRIGFNAYTPSHLLDQLCYGFHLKANTFDDNRIGAVFEQVKDCSVENNRFLNHVELALQLKSNSAVRVADNDYQGNVRDTAIDTLII